MTFGADTAGSAAGANRNFWKRNQRAMAPWLFLAPGVIMFLIYVIWPIFSSMWISFFDWDGLSPRTWLGFGNYVELIDDDAFYTSLYNNILWLALYMLAVPAGLFIAIFLNQTVTGIRLYKSLFFFLRDQPGRRRTDILLVLCAEFRIAVRDHRIPDRNRRRGSGR